MWLLTLGAILAIVGFLWAFDLPFNKPRWSPAYLVYTSGVGAIVLGALYFVIDVKGMRAWAYPLVVFGVNALAAYFVIILVKVLLLNTPRVQVGGRTMRLIDAILLTLKEHLGAWAGGWVFTIGFISIWWVIFALAYRKRLFWKI